VELSFGDVAGCLATQVDIEAALGRIIDGNEKGSLTVSLAGWG